MSGVFKPKSPSQPASSPVSSLRLQTSSKGRAIPIAYGRTRISGNLIWFGDFKSTTHNENAGGKGGGGGTASTTYSYSTAFLMAVCEGAVNSIPRIWRQKQVFIGHSVGGTILTKENEAHVINFAGWPTPPTVTVVNAATFYADVQIQVYVAGAGYVNLIPGTDYTVTTGGVYSFLTLLHGNPVYITYGYASGTIIQDACSELALTLNTGTYSQNAPGWLTTKHPTEALNYRGTCYVDSSSYALGDVPDLPNHSFEVDTQSAFSLSIRDANPMDVILDLLVNKRYGLQFPPNKIGDLTEYGNFCVANNIFISPVYLESAPTKDILTSLMIVTNSGIVFSEGLLKVLPYGDVYASANGAAYTPNTTPVYDLTDDEFIYESGTDPVQVIRKTNADAYNHVRGKYFNRDNEYNEDIAEAKDQYSIETYGLRSMPVIDMPEICNQVYARSVVQLLLQRQLYIRNTYTFKLGWNFALLEPMDIVTLTDAYLGMSRTPVRIIAIEEDDSGLLTMTAEEYPVNVLNAATYNIQPPGGFVTNQNQDPGSANTPVIFEAPITLSSNKSGLELWLATGSANVNYGGCQIWVSTDNATYKNIGQLDGNSRYGTLTSALSAHATPGMYSETYGVHLLAGGQLTSGTLTDAQLLQTLCYVDGEYTAFQTAALTGASAYDLTTINRGAYYSDPNVTHTVGSSFVRCDDGIAKLALDSNDYVGKTIYIKLLAYNTFNNAVQDLSAVSPTTYVVTGKFVNMPPIAIGNFGLIGSFNIGNAVIKWDGVPNATSYNVQVWTGSPTLVKVRDVTIGNTLSFEYTWQDSANDGGPYRAVTFKVAPISNTGIFGPYATLAVSNPQISTLTNIFVTPGPMSFEFKCLRPADTDFKGIRVHMFPGSSGFTPNGSNLIYDGPDTTITVSRFANGGSLVAGTTYWFKAAGYDTLGIDSLNYSAGTSGVAAAAVSNQNATAYLYQWSTTTPSNPSGASTYTWATGTSSAYTGGASWSTTIPSNPGTPGIFLWIATKQVSDLSTATTTSVSWSSGFAVNQSSQNGAAGTQAGTPTVYQWAATIPSGPVGSATYTWATGLFGSAPSGWSLTPGTSPSVGYTLWAAKVPIVDTATNATTSFNWTSAGITAAGYAGTNGTPGGPGSPGSNGASYRTAYLDSTVPTAGTSPNPEIAAGSTFTPSSHWGLGGTWQTTVPTLSAGEYMYQSDGIYDPVANQTSWSIPYWSSLKVGSLSAITANLGSITAGSLNAVSISAASISGGTMTSTSLSSSTITGGSATMGPGSEFQVSTAGVVSASKFFGYGSSFGNLINPAAPSIAISSFTGSTSDIVTVAANSNTNAISINNAGSAGGGLGSTAATAISINGNFIAVAKSGTLGSAIMNSVVPTTNNTYTCGSSGSAWAGVYSYAYTTVVSDMRLKTDIEVSDIGLDIILALNPISWRMIEGGKAVVQDYTELQGPVRIGESLILQPVIESVPGVRRHYGFGAQEVIKVLGGKDCGIWNLADKNDPESAQSLRYEGFIAPIVKAIQELNTRKDEEILGLKNDILVMENRVKLLESK